jgi:RNA polymerase sigma factor (sigma-70 family)
MDRYAYVIEQLRRDDFKRLREYAAQERSTFTTWLVVVTRRLCLDYRRRRYGRPRGEADPATQVERVIRKRLVDFVAEDLELSRSVSSNGPDPEMELRTAELRESLSAALNSLSAGERLLLAFRYEQGLTARQIARLLDFPSVFHVYRRLTAVQQSLRTTLAGRGIDGASP